MGRAGREAPLRVSGCGSRLNDHPHQNQPEGCQLWVAGYSQGCLQALQQYSYSWGRPGWHKKVRLSNKGTAGNQIQGLCRLVGKGAAGKVGEITIVSTQWGKAL